MRSLTAQTDSCEDMVISFPFNRCKIMDGLRVGILFSRLSMNDFIRCKSAPGICCGSPVEVLGGSVKLKSFLLVLNLPKNTHLDLKILLLLLAYAIISMLYVCACCVCICVCIRVLYHIGRGQFCGVWGIN